MTPGTASDLDQVKDAAMKGALGNGTADNKQRYMEIVMRIDETQYMRARQAEFDRQPSRLSEIRVEGGSAVPTGRKTKTQASRELKQRAPTHPDQITRAKKKGGKKK